MLCSAAASSRRHAARLRVRSMETAFVSPSSSAAVRFIPSAIHRQRPYLATSYLNSAPADTLRPTFISSSSRSHSTTSAAEVKLMMAAVPKISGADHIVASTPPLPPSPLLVGRRNQQVLPQALLSTVHPAFGDKEAPVASLGRPAPSHQLLPTDHPIFGHQRITDAEKFRGPVSVGGIFVAIDPHVSIHGLGAKVDVMNPNAQLTIRDGHGRAARARYVCKLYAATGGFKIEALLRVQLGWIAPKVTFAQLPYTIKLGSGFDVSIPFIAHFTVAKILDEHGCNTGSCLFLSGTPALGFSVGITRIAGGELVHNPKFPIDPDREAAHFVCGMHYRQLGFLVFKIMGYLICAVAASVSLAADLGGFLRNAESAAADTAKDAMQLHQT